MRKYFYLKYTKAESCKRTTLEILKCIHAPRMMCMKTKAINDILNILISYLLKHFFYHDIEAFYLHHITQQGLQTIQSIWTQ